MLLKYIITSEQIGENPLKHFKISVFLHLVELSSPEFDNYYSIP